jgi:hypothetical protein
MKFIAIERRCEMPRFHSYHPERDFKEEKIEWLTQGNLNSIRISLEANNLFCSDHAMGNDEQMAVYRKISRMKEPIFIYIHQANMGPGCRYLALFKGLFIGGKGIYLVLQMGEDEGNPSYKFVLVYHIGKIRIVPSGKLVEWLNYEKDTKWQLWKDRCQYHPSSVEDPEWAGLGDL